MIDIDFPMELDILKDHYNDVLGERNALWAKVNRLSQIIRNAPHAEDCNALKDKNVPWEDYPDAIFKCNCWKKIAFGEVDVE